MNTITAAEALNLSQKAVFIHVLPEEHFAEQHLPKAINACVYEMLFFQRSPNWFPTKAPKSLSMVQVRHLWTHPPPLKSSSKQATQMSAIFAAGSPNG